MYSFRPMKGAVAPEDLTQLRYPLIASEKIDGWRCLVAPISWARTNIKIDKKHQEYFDRPQYAIALSASNKPISNLYVQTQLDKAELIGCDGELIASTKFNETSSAFATVAGAPAFAFHIFDIFTSPDDTFTKRLALLQNRQLLSSCNSNVEIHKHTQHEFHDATKLNKFIESIMDLGAEGIITRDPFAPYKYGRATVKQQWMLKHKTFIDAEAIVVGFEELMHNENASEVNQLGLQRRSHHQAGKVGGNKLGALVCKHLGFGGISLNSESGMKPQIVGVGESFRIGTGFTDSDRHLLWAQREDLFGRIVKYKSMKKGSVDLPRHPVFLGFRAEDFS